MAHEWVPAPPAPPGWAAPPPPGPPGAAPVWPPAPPGAPAWPAAPPAPPSSAHRLRAVSELPPAFRCAFAGAFRFFNPIQSECFDLAFLSDDNAVVAAPTGGGKTAVLELALLRLQARYLSPDGAAFAPRPGLLKAVYVAPAKALVAERTADWGARLGALGLAVREVTGETGEEAEAAALEGADVLCTTPEKFDALSRRRAGAGAAGFLSDVALVLIDEVHLLAEGGRGAALEAGIVGRLRAVAALPGMARAPVAACRFVAVSATVPNVGDVAEWLGAPARAVRVFGEETRPVPLTVEVRGYAPAPNDFLFDRRLTEHLFGVIAERSRGRPALVFCASRAGAAGAAAAVARGAAAAAAGGAPSALLRNPPHLARLTAAAAAARAPGLAAALGRGVGFHHAAMEPKDRAAVEALFRAGDLPVRNLRAFMLTPRSDKEIN